MFATFNLQLMPTTTLDTAPETAVGIPVLTTEPSALKATGFAQLMQLQTDTGTETEIPYGDFVPEGGNILPVAESIPTDSEELPAIDVAASLLAEANIDGDVNVESDAPMALTAWTPVATLPDAPVDEIVSIIPQVQRPVAESAAIHARVDVAQPAAAPRLNPEVAVADALKPLAPPIVEANQIAPAVAAVTPAVRDIVQPDRRDVMMVRTEQPVMPREVAAAPQMIVSPESDVVPRAVALPDAAAVPDRSLPSNFASVVNQVAGGVPRDPALLPPVATDLVRTPVSDPSWGDRIGQRVVMMAGNQVQQAEIRLTPAELGPVRVQIAVEDGAANVTFQAQHAVTREAIEAAMPRLREMLAESGLSLGQTNVGGDGVAEGQREREENAQAASNTDAGSDFNEDGQPERQKSVTSDGLIDTFA